MSDKPQGKIMVLFDWNMSLLDDGPVWYGAVSKIFDACGKKAPSAEVFLQKMAENKGRLIQTYALWGISLHAKEQLEAAQRIYNYGYYARIEEVRLSPGALEAVQALHELGVPMGIISGENLGVFKAVMDKFNLWRFFDSRIFLQIEDKSEPILQLLRRETVSPHRCFFVGDTPSDIYYAKKAGVKAVVYLNGFMPENLVVDARHDFTIRHFKELLPLVKNVLQL